MKPVRFTNRKNNPEGLIQRAILEYMQYHGIMAWRMNAGKVVVGDQDHKRFIQLGQPGIPDLIGVIGPRFKNGKLTGKMIAVEVKVPKNKPTDIQNLVIQELKEHGALVNVLHSVDELEDWFLTL